MVIGHVGPEAALGGPVALIEDGDEIIVDLNTNTLNCTEFDDSSVYESRKAKWQQQTNMNHGVHPNCRQADTRLLQRARHSAVPAIRGGGLHPKRQVWVRSPRLPELSGFKPVRKT